MQVGYLLKLEVRGCSCARCKFRSLRKEFEATVRRDDRAGAGAVPSDI